VPEEITFQDALRHAEEFFMGESAVQKALDQVTTILEELAIPYAIVGAMALNAYGYQRVTTDVDLLLTREGLAAFKAARLGRGYSEKFPGSKGVRDAIHGVNIDVLIAGDFPGDGKPKPVSFPDPAALPTASPHRLAPLATLVELKIASGMTAPHRLKDLADVLELIRARRIPAAFGDALHPFVREKFAELHLAAQGGADDEA
jgi:hypothetical protein